MPPTIPQEIKDEILSHLWDDNDSLKASSLASRSLLQKAQMHLFSKITIFPPDSKDEERWTAARFQSLIESSPHLALYIQYIEILDWLQYRRPEWLSRDIALSLCLSRLRNLKGLVIRYQGADEKWLSIAQGGLLASIIDVLQFPNLTFLDITGLPVGLITHCPNLRHLVLDEPRPLGIDLAAHNGSKIYLETLDITLSDVRNYTPGAKTVQSVFQGILRDKVDISGMRRLAALVDSGIEGHHYIWMIMKQCIRTLQELVFEPCIKIYVPDVAIADPIDWGSLTSLRKFTIRFEVSDTELSANYGGDPTPFPWFMSIFRKLTDTNQRLEEFVIRVSYYADDLDDIDLSELAEVACLLADRDRFPCMKKVEFQIEASVGGREPDETDDLMAYLEECVEGLREIQMLDVQASVVKFSHSSRAFSPDPRWKGKPE